MLIAYLDCNDEVPSVSDPPVFPQIPAELGAQKPENLPDFLPKARGLKQSFRRGHSSEKRAGI